MKRRHYLGATTTAMLGGLAGCMGDPEYTITSVSSVDTAGPLTFDVEIADSAITVDSPGSLDVRLRNDGETAVEIRNTGVWPFGILALIPPDENGMRTLLLTDQYAETDHVEVTANSTGTDNTRLVRTLAAGESVTERYRIHGKRLRGNATYSLGDYFEDVLISYRTGDSGTWSELHPEVSVTIAERSLLP